MSAIFLSVLNVLTPLLLGSEYSCRTRPISLLLIPGFLAFLMLAQNYTTCRGFTLFCAKTGCTSSNWCLVDGLMQKRCNTSALVMELYLYYINASILWPTMMHHLTPCVTVFHACETMGGILIFGKPVAYFQYQSIILWHWKYTTGLPKIRWSSVSIFIMPTVCVAQFAGSRPNNYRTLANRGSYRQMCPTYDIDLNNRRGISQDIFNISSNESFCKLHFKIYNLMYHNPWAELTMGHLILV